MKLTKPFAGVKAGEIYPTQFEPGDEVPPELEDAAVATGAADADKPRPRRTKQDDE